MIRCPANHSRGFTLIEVTIAAAVGALLFVTVGSLTDATGNSMQLVSASYRIDTQIDRAIARLSDDLKRTSIDTLEVDHSSPDHDSILLRVPEESTDGAWGYVDRDDTFRVNWSAEYVVIDGELLQRLYDNRGNLVADSERLLCRDVDSAIEEDGETTKGFQVQVTGSLVHLLLRVADDVHHSGRLVRAEETTLHVVNP